MYSCTRYRNCTVADPGFLKGRQLPKRVRQTCLLLFRKIFGGENSMKMKESWRPWRPIDPPLLDMIKTPQNRYGISNELTMILYNWLNLQLTKSTTWPLPFVLAQPAIKTRNYPKYDSRRTDVKIPENSHNIFLQLGLWSTDGMGDTIFILV